MTIDSIIESLEIEISVHEAEAEREDYEHPRTPRERGFLLGQAQGKKDAIRRLRTLKLLKA